MAFLTSGHYAMKLRNVKNVSRSIILLCTHGPAGRGRPQVAAKQHVAARHPRAVRVLRSGRRRQTLIYIWSLPLALSLDGVPFPIHPQSFVCHSYLRIYGDAEDSRGKRSEGKKERPELRWFPSSLFHSVFLFFPTPDPTPSFSSPPSGRPTKRAAVSI